ncbi:hypothetical protein J42TS3_08280 [Paenibacillus vini]|uniref:Core-binding (CB) domain-containing protein n=1 Tax=Paenibacillus vini TaxID=1476024 RepID=A0ABQ4M723_9BACL|nr:hypothetical protein J42TS3_08280 [Paenibacillus vini]
MSDAIKKEKGRKTALSRSLATFNSFIDAEDRDLTGTVVTYRRILSPETDLLAPLLHHGKIKPKSFNYAG